MKKFLVIFTFSFGGVYDRQLWPAPAGYLSTTRSLRHKRRVWSTDSWFGGERKVNITEFGCIFWGKQKCNVLSMLDPSKGPWTGTQSERTGGPSTRAPCGRRPTTLVPQNLKTSSHWELELQSCGVKGQGEEGLWRMPCRSSGKARMTASMWALSLARVPGRTGSCSLSAWVCRRVYCEPEFIQGLYRVYTGFTELKDLLKPCWI